LLRIIKQHKIDLLTHHDIGMQRDVKTLYWQPDFQHKIFPDFFSPKECVDRDRSIARVSEWGHILLSSQAAVDDFRMHFPELAHVRAHILHFSSPTSLDTPLMAWQELESRFPVREPFFFLPNQFWRHKNHGVVVDALSRTASEIRVLCSGSMHDRRDEMHVPNLLEKVNRTGLKDRFVCLGSIGYREVISLMHHSIAVIQPSLFEGWSTSVEEAKALRKRILLTNLPVHLEQAPDRGTFFSPDSPDQLADCLTQVYREFDPIVEEKFVAERSSRREGVEKMWMDDYARIVRDVLGQPATVIKG
jgi:glycosyltransferase involved in cell wall biosynthesis